LESKSASVDISITNINSFTASNANQSLNQLTSSLATTGSNTFKGTTIISGSTYIQGDFVVFGSSSIQYISASSVSIGTNIVQLNTNQPAVRFGGLSVQDSGSAVGVTGSMFWDGCCNRWIYSNPSGVGYSGGVLMSGPRGSTLGNEPTLTCNYIAKSGGGDHLYDSCIIDDGTTVCVNANLKGSGTACFAGAVCTPTIQSANVCTDGSYGSRVVAYGSNVGMFVNSTGAGEGYYRILNGACSIGALAATGWYKGSAEQNMGIITGPSKSFQIATNDCANARLTIGSDGISVFACQVCAPKVISTHFSGTCLTLNGFSSGNGLKMDYGSASGEITAINLIANGTTNGFIGIQMVDGSNGDLWLGSSANRSMTIYRTGNHGFNTNTPCTRVHVEGGYGSRWGGDGCFYGGGVSGGGMPYGDVYGNGASYTYQTCNGNSNNSSLNGGFAAGYFKGGPGSSYGGGGAGIVAIGGNGGNAESVNAGGGAGIFARGGLNGASTALSYAGWFDGGDVMVRCGSVLSCAPKNGYNFRALGFATGTIASGGSCLIFSNLDRGLYLISIASSVTSTFGYSAFLWVDSGNITVSSVIRQSCVAISTSGRYLCVVNQYTAEAASMTITTLNLLNYIG
jgi:hypothetical protein